MAIFTNQASLIVGDTVTNSNVTRGEIVTGVRITKTAIPTTYRAGDSIVYIVNISSRSGGALNGLTFTDDLGAYTPDGQTAEVVPLDLVENSLIYLVGGEQQTAPEITAGPPLTIENLSIPAGESITLIYEARVNGFAPLETGSTIVNTASVDGVGIDGETASATVTALSGTNLSIAKALSPAIVGADGILTYTFIVQNTGNEAVVATDDAIIRDLFNPILSDITVTLNGESIAEGTGYEYDEATGLFQTLPGQLPVPAATFTRDEETGIVTLTPGVVVVTVTGTI